MTSKNPSSTSRKSSFLEDYSHNVIGGAADTAVTEGATALVGDTATIIASKIGGAKGRVVAATLSVVAEKFIGTVAQEGRESALDNDSLSGDEIIKDLAQGTASELATGAILGVFGITGLPLLVGTVVVGALLDTIAGVLDQGGPGAVVESYGSNQAEQVALGGQHINQGLEENIPNPHNSTAADSRTPGQIALEEGNPMDNELIRNRFPEGSGDTSNQEGTETRPPAPPVPGEEGQQGGNIPGQEENESHERNERFNDDTDKNEVNERNRENDSRNSNNERNNENNEPGNSSGEAGQEGSGNDQGEDEGAVFGGSSNGDDCAHDFCYQDEKMEIIGDIEEDSDVEIPNPANEDQGDPDANSDSPLRDVDADIDHGPDHEKGGDLITGYELLMEWNGKIDGDPIGELQHDANAVGRFDWLIKIDPVTNWGPDGKQSDDPVNNEIIDHIEGINPRFMDSLGTMMDSKDLSSAVIGVDLHSDNQIFIAAFTNI